MDDSKEMAALMRNLRTVMPDLDLRDVSPRHDLAGLGCNSIDRMDVVTMTMEDLGVAIPVAEFRDVQDIGALVALLRKHADTCSPRA